MRRLRTQALWQLSHLAVELRQPLQSIRKWLSTL